MHDAHECVHLWMEAVLVTRPWVYTDHQTVDVIPDQRRMTRSIPVGDKVALAAIRRRKGPGAEPVRSAARAVFELTTDGRCQQILPVIQKAAEDSPSSSLSPLPGRCVPFWLPPGGMAMDEGSGTSVLPSVPKGPQSRRSISLDVSSAAPGALMGASGSGKSTLLHLVGGLDSPTAGSIWVGEVDVAGLQGRRLVQHRRRVGFVFQAFNPDSRG